MPKKPIEYNKSFNVRVSEFEYNQWKDFVKKSVFSGVSKLIRYCVNSFLDGTIKETSGNNRDDLKSRINELEERNLDLTKEYTKVLKMISSKTDIKQESTLDEYRREILLNLLEEGPKDEIELNNILNISEAELLTMLNVYLEIGKITRSIKNPTKYEVNL